MAAFWHTIALLAALGVNAGSIQVEGVVDSLSLKSDGVSKSGGFLSSTTTTTHYEGTDQAGVSSTLSGDTVSLRSTGDTTILGSNVVGTGHVSVVAGGTLTVGAVAAQDHEAQSARVKKSGLSVGGGGLFLGAANNRNESTVDSVTHKGSLVGSATGNATLVADGVLTVSGSQVVSPGKTTLAGERVIIEHVTDTVDTTNASKSSSFGVTLGVQSSLLNGVQTAVRMGEIAAGSDNDRVAAVAGLAGGLAAHNAAEAVTSDPKALGGANVSLSLGFSKSSSSGASHDETVIGSTVRGHDIKLIASGAGAASTIRVTGSDVVASNALLLSADGGIIAEAATERDTVSGTSKSVGAGVGVSLGIGGAQAGPTLNASFSSAKGAYAGEEVSHRGTVLAGGGTTKVVTSGTLTLDGAQLVGNRVEGDVGNLVLASRQDTATYSASHKSVGASVSLAPGGAVNGALNLGSGQQQGDYASVAEQAGIYAGSGGYDIAVAGKTSLTGAVIASEADPANNRLSTGTLELGEIDNRERWSASQTQLDLGLGAHIGKTAASSGTRDPGTSLAGVNLPGLGRVSATPPVALGASGRQSGTTVSAIAPGTIEITSPDAASLAAAASVSRDPAHANAGALIREFDDTERQEIAAGFDAARTLAKETGTVFANRAKAETVLRDEAAAAQARGDTAEYERLTSEADKLNQTYGGGSAARLLATAITGAAGGDVTGSLGGLAQGAAVNVLQGLAASEIKTIADSLDGTAESEAVRAGLQALAGCAGAAAGGSGDCGSAALGAASSVVLNFVLTELVDPKPEIDPTTGLPRPRGLEDQEARKNLVTSLVTAIAEGAGLDAVSAKTAAQLETENNALCSSGHCVVRKDNEAAFGILDLAHRDSNLRGAIEAAKLAGESDEAFAERYGHYAACAVADQQTCSRPGDPAMEAVSAAYGLSDQAAQEQLASDHTENLGELASGDPSASADLINLPEQQRNELADAFAKLPEAEREAYRQAALVYANEAASSQFSEAGVRAALILFEGLPSASVMSMPGAELAAKYGPQIRSIASRSGESPAAIIGLLTGAAIGVELLKPDYDDVKGTDLSQGNPWGSSDLGDPEPDPKVPLIAPPLDEQVGIRDGQAVYKDSLTGAEYVTDLYGNRVPTAVDTEVPGVGRFNNVQARDASEAQFLANVEAALSNSTTWVGVTRHRGELVIQRSDIELSPENITLMKNGQAPFVRGANGDWEQVQLHHVGRETGQMIEVTRSQNSYNSATGGPLHIPGPGGPVRQPGFSQSYWQERYQNLVNSGQIAP